MQQGEGKKKKKMDKAFVLPLELLQRAKDCLLSNKLSDYDDTNHINNALKALSLIDNAITKLSYENLIKEDKK